MAEVLPEPAIAKDEDFEEFIALCNQDAGWDICYDKEGILMTSLFIYLFLLCTHYFCPLNITRNIH